MPDNTIVPINNIFQCEDYHRSALFISELKRPESGLKKWILRQLSPCSVQFERFSWHIKQSLKEHLIMVSMMKRGNGRN